MGHLFVIALPLIIPITLLVALFAIGNLFLDCPLFLVMASSASIVFFLTFVYGINKKSFSKPSLPIFIWQGFRFMQGAISILFLGSILASFLHNYLQTGQYLTQLASLNMPTAFLPLMFFLLSLSITLTTGSAWNTFTLMVTLAFPMATSLFSANIDQATFLLTFYPLLGAIFSGAVCGDHISPSSETTVMTASSVGIPPEAHTLSQIYYVIPVLIGTTFSFTIVGFLANYPYWLQTSLSSIGGIVISIALLALFNQWKKHDKKRDPA
jgi:Na+/H+ antiporter NhaC